MGCWGPRLCSAQPFLYIASMFSRREVLRLGAVAAGTSFLPLTAISEQTAAQPASIQALKSMRGLANSGFGWRTISTSPTMARRCSPPPARPSSTRLDNKTAFFLPLARTPEERNPCPDWFYAVARGAPGKHAISVTYVTDGCAFLRNNAPHRINHLGGCDERRRAGRQRVSVNQRRGVVGSETRSLPLFRVPYRVLLTSQRWTVVPPRNRRPRLLLRESRGPSQVEIVLGL